MMQIKPGICQIFCLPYQIQMIIDYLTTIKKRYALWKVSTSYKFEADPISGAEGIDIELPALNDEVDPIAKLESDQLTTCNYNKMSKLGNFDDKKMIHLARLNNKRKINKMENKFDIKNKGSGVVDLIEIDQKY